MQGQWLYSRLSTLVLLATMAGSLSAHDGAQRVVPEREREKARQLQAAGPQRNAGISTVTALGNVPLAGEIPDDSDRMLRARELTIAPGGVVAVHEHDQRPGVAYILSGAITEHRSDRDVPVVHETGSVAFERSGVTHWWENHSDAPVRALVVDIVPEVQP